MDKARIDSLARAVATAATRRVFMAAIFGSPLLRSLTPDAPPAAAHQRRGHRPQNQRRRKRGKIRRQDRRDEAHAEACIPTGQRCPSKKVRGKAGKKLGCNACCQGSFTTDAAGKKVCGCQPNGGSCSTATSSSCCSGYCDGSTCQIPPSAPCPRTCSGCCDGNGGCQAGISNSACGIGGACSTCAGATPICQDHVCVACTSTSQCPANTICDPSGACLPCDVCASGSCAFASVRAAIDATPPLATIRVCAGTYVETGTGGAVRITRNLRLIGAGDGSQPGQPTIVRPASENQAVVVITTPISPATVSLERLQITGAFGNGGFGLLMNNALVTLDTCTITDNHVTDTSGGGMEIFGNESRVALINTHVTGNSSTFGGGGIAIQRGQLTLDAQSRVTGNTTTGNPGGGIYAAQALASVDLQGLANVSDNDPNDCGGTGTFTGPGAVCTGT